MITKFNSVLELQNFHIELNNTVLANFRLIMNRDPIQFFDTMWTVVTETINTVYYDNSYNGVIGYIKLCEYSHDINNLYVDNLENGIHQYLQDKIWFNNYN